jgi:uncharacterized protein YdhG (YjbR/CyaY superfamily)
MTARQRAASMDACLAALPSRQREALEQLRQAITRAAPKAEECVSDGLPAFRLDGRMFVGFGAAAKHCAFHLWSGRTVDAHPDPLAKYDTDKGSVRFPADEPLPVALARRLVKARIAENAGG